MDVDLLFLPPPVCFNCLLVVGVPPVAKTRDESGDNRSARVAQIEPSPRFEEGFQKAVQVAVVTAFVGDIGRDHALVGSSNRVLPIEIGDLVAGPCPVPGGVVGGEYQCVFDVIGRFDAPTQARQRYADQPQAAAQLDGICRWQSPVVKPSRQTKGRRPHLGPVRKALMTLRIPFYEPVQKSVGIRSLDDGQLKVPAHGYGRLPGVVLAQGALYMPR